ncbi:histidine kinase [Salegentibacter sp. HM20]
MQGTANQTYRITYETYSKFANKLNRCSSLDEVAAVMQQYLKYLLNFQVLRLAIWQNETYLVFTAYQNKLDYFSIPAGELFSSEKDILEKQIPVKTSKIPQEFSEYIDLNQAKNAELWAWFFRKKETHILTSLVADDRKSFKAGDVEILKLIVDSIETKAKELFLKEELHHKNQSLLQALDVIQNQNREIKNIVENQQQIIEKRTREVVEKNEKLLHISALNAHNLREPLSRIQGIMQLIEIVDDKTCREELVPMLKTSASDMDAVLKEVIEMASTELLALKANEL